MIASSQLGRICERVAVFNAPREEKFQTAKNFRLANKSPVPSPVCLMDEVVAILHRDAELLAGETEELERGVPR